MRSQKGTALTWVVFATLTVVAFAALWAIQNKPKAPVVPIEKAEETPKKPFKGFAKEALTPEKQAELDNEALNAALRSGAGCEAIQFDEVMRQRCLDTQAYDIALRNLDEKRCAEIKDTAMRSDCLDRVYSALSGQSLDLALCDKIGNAELKQQCKDRIQASMGRSATSAKDCEGIVDQGLRQGCLDDFMLASSVQNLNLESCGSIQNSDLKSRCSQTVTKNLQVIELGKNQMVRQYQGTQATLAGCADQGCRDEANFNLAGEKKDLAYCNAIVDPALEKNCVETQGAAINKYYMRLATAKKDATLCTRILDAELRTSCQTFDR
ncbi:hypothetical protein HZA44_04650 [Candidatus Peregrinibacteria bacterium]|nr:hypothetical protein [Candidatus Peregrinibacteria bacterium]